MSYNRTILTGNLTRDPQLSYMPNQKSVCEFGFASNRKWTGQDGSQREEVLFIDCKMFGKRGEAVNRYCVKGDPLLVEGHLVLDVWKQQDGLNRSKIRLIVDSFEFIGSKEDKPAEQHDRKETPVQDSEIPF